MPTLKRLIPIGARDWLRSARRGNPYRREPGRVPVRIGDLVSPLRYDVLVRAAHFEFHAAHRELFAADFAGYEERARSTAYRAWFERVMAPAWLAHLADDAEGLEEAWRDRLRRAAALHESFQQRGFDRAHPIELHAGRTVRPAATGKRASRALFAGDGNHRLALLMAAGREVLEASEYCVKRYRCLVPADTTGILLEETGAGWPEYERFVRLGYPEARVAPDGTAEHPSAAVAAEVRAVLAVDLPHLTPHRT